MKEVLIKLVMAATFPLWAFPYMFWQIASDVYDRHSLKKIGLVKK